MFMHNKRLQYTVRVSESDPGLANLLLEQFGGPQGELAAAMRYFTQAVAEEHAGRKDMLYDIATEELSHLEIIGSIVAMLNRGAKGELAEAVDEALAANGLSRRDVDWLVPHQANARIIDAMGRKLGLASERVVITVDRHANTSAASVPLALAEARCDGRIRRGDLVLLEALGGGLTWGSALVRM